jgi:hypothetical protein
MWSMSGFCKQGVKFGEMVPNEPFPEVGKDTVKAHVS